LINEGDFFFYPSENISDGKKGDVKTIVRSQDTVKNLKNIYIFITETIAANDWIIRYTDKVL